ncbi:Decaprenyl diphosphate synthase-like protein [Neohortaea acidophila]|uniref:ditrans,polycis-polyprenyl diphosphate synthase [(2E,6E)-farnesyldiphosphate specific] n=1 Tax=Neohortaea acidophila TaxID=245834 RepID=A0A6A6PMK1_9PEZI|nr:Decaprenyl diphosphate synthase-like protein [Neohortaea acidophila]KAF2480487.1 Decaprenyl diphosphate synthase-like protein [Neohortaea acidophila]
MVGARHAQAFHADVDEQGRRLSARERERLLKPYLPPTPKPETSHSSAAHKSPLFQHKKRVRPAIRHAIHSLIFTIIHVFFSVYIRLREAYHAVVNQIFTVLYYHHRTPELIKKDMKNLSKVPKHLSVILQQSPAGGDKDSLETLMNDACEIAAWTASAGIPVLSIYERTGILKHSLPHLHRRISRTMTSYYGEAAASKPTISLRAPHLPSYSPPTSPEPPTNGDDADGHVHHPHLAIMLIDESDGRQTLVDLTKTLAEMAQHGKLSPEDISSELIDAEISESVMMEPDLIILFGDQIVLDGYPPWQARLSEMFYVQDHVGGVGYHVFLRALYKYGQAQFRVGT